MSFAIATFAAFLLVTVVLSFRQPVLHPAYHRGDDFHTLKISGLRKMESSAAPHGRNSSHRPECEAAGKERNWQREMRAREGGSNFTRRGLRMTLYALIPDSV